MEILKQKSTWRTVNLILAIGLITYAIIAGLTNTISYQNPINGQTSRNIFFHVPQWFAMMVMGYTAVVFSIGYLRNGKLKWDMKANEAAKLTVLFGLLGLISGIVWSRVTWAETLPGNDFQAWWRWDPKQTTALVGTLIYLGYFVLRMSFDEPIQRAKVAAVYNIFAAASIYPLYYVIPKVLEGQHPGAGGEEGAIQGMSPDYYAIFWPAVFGFICLSIWIFDLRTRAAHVEMELNELEYE